VKDLIRIAMQNWKSTVLKLTNELLKIHQYSCSMIWLGLSSVLRPRQRSIGYMGDGLYRSKDPTNSIKVLKEKATKENNPSQGCQAWTAVGLPPRYPQYDL